MRKKENLLNEKRTCECPTLAGSKTNRAIQLMDFITNY